MIRISHLKLRNFKSFKNLNIELPQGVVCLAGPNGAGKSNITDSIVFALGETSLKSLRAKRVKDLIHVDSRAAEVWIKFDGDEKYEIKRAIRDDGKIIYRLNGKRTTRSSILEVLKKYNLDASGRNIIAQGEVQRIANISGKERRQIVDAVAGISDFEQKKKEALSELGTVDARINEANIVLGERMAFLNELGKERDMAIRYKQSKESLDGARATLIKMELEKSRKELEKSETRRQELDEKMVKLKLETERNNEEMEKTAREKSEITAELQKKQRTSDEIRKIEELKARIAALNEKIKEKKETLGKISKEKNEIETQLARERNLVDDLKGVIKKLEEELAEASKNANAQKIQPPSAIEELRTKKEAAEKELQALKEKNAAISAETKAKTAQLEMLKKQIEELHAAETGRVEEGSIEEMKEEAGNISRQLEELFQNTKEINKRIGELEKEMLELKEKSSIYRARASPHLMNHALKYIDEARQKEKGMYGTVADLIQFDPSLARAVEAAAGARLLYVVVDTANLAVRMIEKLKKDRLGRATFIPLDSIKTNEQKGAAGLERLITKISFKPELRKAIEYAFGDTVLVRDHEDAKKVGIGKCRMVTYEGDIYEMTGTIAGGFAESGIMAQNQLKKLEDAFATAKKEKEELMKRLYDIREEEAGLRARKARIEIEVKTLEAGIKERMEEARRLKDKREKMEQEVKTIQESIRDAEEKRENMQKKIEALILEVEKTAKKLENAEKEDREKNEALNKKARELAEKISMLRATIEGKKKEQEIIQRSLNEKTNKFEELVRDERSIETEVKNAVAEAEQKTKQLNEEEMKMRARGRLIEELFAKIKQYEEKLQEIGGKNDLLRREMTAVEKELAQLDVKKAGITTKLDDLETEIQKYAGVKTFEEYPRQKLVDMIAEAEQTLNEIGANVNLAAIEAYAKKEAEINEVKQKIDRLSDERNAIMKMIDEIEERKKDAFFEAFDTISSNFKQMFSYINIGEGYLLLDKPNEPFESGLYIKIRHGNHDYPMDALSGGEVAIVSLMFIFALQFFKPAPFYILDEVDAALDKENSKRMVQLIKKMSKDSQFIVVSHNDTVIANSDIVYGVTKVGNTSKVVAVKLEGLEEGKEMMKTSKLVS